MKKSDELKYYVAEDHYQVHAYVLRLHRSGNEASFVFVFVWFGDGRCIKLSNNHAMLFER